MLSNYNTPDFYSVSNWCKSGCQCFFFVLFFFFEGNIIILMVKNENDDLYKEDNNTIRSLV